MESAWDIFWSYFLSPISSDFSCVYYCYSCRFEQAVRNQKYQISLSRTTFMEKIRYEDKFEFRWMGYFIRSRLHARQSCEKEDLRLRTFISDREICSRKERISSSYSILQSCFLGGYYGDVKCKRSTKLFIEERNRKLSFVWTFCDRYSVYFRGERKCRAEEPSQRCNSSKRIRY